MSDLNERAARALFPDSVECGCDCGKHKWNLSLNMQMPEHFDPCNNRNHTAMLEADIRERGVKDDYITALLVVISYYDEDVKKKVFGYDNLDAFWNIATATPEQRTRAYLTTVEASDE